MKTEELYRIEYYDTEEACMKTYLNNTAFTSKEAIEEIRKIRRDYPERRYVHMVLIRTKKRRK